MNLFYKIHLQNFSAISIVFYHSGPAFGQVLYSCLDAFVVDAFVPKIEEATPSEKPQKH
jgi:hypothetical protein